VAHRLNRLAGAEKSGGGPKCVSENCPPLMQVIRLAAATLRVIMLSGCRGKPAVNKHRMNQELSLFAARLRDSIVSGFQNQDFDSLAVELFSLQFEHNAIYQRMCLVRKVTPQTVCAIRGMTPSFAGRWTQIPFIPTGAFKAIELSCIQLTERTAIFHSSGTTDQEPSRHFHNTESLAVYEASLWKWFQFHFGRTGELVFLTPNQIAAPRSSLVHMFETVRQMFGLPEAAFTGHISTDGSWTIDFDATIQRLKIAADGGKPLTLLGTAFSFVHLLDYLKENNLQFQLPENSRVMETGGYKNRSRTMPKAELHALIGKFLGVPRENIICEYGMSEFSSQAYAVTSDKWGVISTDATTRHSSPVTHHFRFPPWARVQIVSPETGREVGEGETGLIRVFDLANVFSVAAIQTEDLAIRRDDGFELVGRAQLAEPRGCSLMTA
jgi:Acyl-protein synthetase, LuxE